MLATLRYFWRSNLAVVLASAITTAVLTGALLVGDSVRGSLRELTLDRLGGIDDALLGEQFFRATLAEDLHPGQGSGPEGLRAVAPAILMQGSVRHADSGARANQVNIQGIDERFAELFPAQAAELVFGRAEGQSLPSIVINRALAEELGAAVGDTLVMALERPSDVPRETLMGSTAASDLLRSQRLVVRAVLPDEGAGRFSMAPHQSLALNAYLSLPDLQRSLGQRGRVNTLLVAWDEALAVDDLAQSAARIERLESTLREALELDDLGLRVEEVVPDHEEGEPAAALVEITSREVLLRPGIADQLQAWAAAEPVEVQRLSTYLANLSRRPGVPVRGGETSASYLPYSTISAIETPVPAVFGELLLEDGSPAPRLAEDEVLVNRWAADDLGVESGERIAVDYFEVGEREELTTRTIELTVRGVLEMSGLGADRSLTPDFPGVADADSMSDWDPTFPVDLSLIRERDEEYWDLYRGAPKLFVAETLGPRLWGSRFGDLSSIRVASDELSPTELRESLERSIPREIDLRSAGLVLEPVKARGLNAARGATDFGGLFIGFSLFLIVAAALLVALFFGLGVERRAGELGLRLAVGFDVRAVRRQFSWEGLLLGGLGALLGLLGAVAYGAAMMAGLRTLWVGAVGTPFLELHVEPVSLALGFVISLAVIAFSIWRAVRRLSKMSTVGLLRGVASEPATAKGSRRARWVALSALVGAVGLTAASMAMGQARAAPLFFGVGACVLVLGLALFALWLARPASGELESGVLGLVRMAAANASMNPGRTLLAAALVASACFVIVAVGSYGLEFGEEVREIDSGAGGYALLARSDVPLYHDLGSADGRFDLGFSDADSALLADSLVVPFRVVPGDDVSCLNLYQPERPRLLGVPREQVEREGFPLSPVGEGATILGSLDDGTEADAWDLLDANLGDNVIPAFGDYNSVTWILKLVNPLGQVKDVVLENERGEAVRVRLVGQFRRSIFQSELLISEDQLERHWPSRDGWSYFLIDSPEAEGKREETLQATLESNLAPYGFDTSSTAQVLQSFQAVENTYLATFQTLGGLGLLLGTVGLAVILLRNVLERRGELATLRAIGYRRRRLGWLVVSENAVVLVVGVLIGTVAALVAIVPHLAEARASVPWASLAATLVLVIAVGTLACVGAVRSALRVDLIPALRRE